jgi:hypothetical protein
MGVGRSCRVVGICQIWKLDAVYRFCERSDGGELMMVG